MPGFPQILNSTEPCSSCSCRGCCQLYAGLHPFPKLDVLQNPALKAQREKAEAFGSEALLDTLRGLCESPGTPLNVQLVEQAIPRFGLQGCGLWGVLEFRVQTFAVEGAGVQRVRGLGLRTRMGDQDGKEQR